MQNRFIIAAIAATIAMATPAHTSAQEAAPAATSVSAYEAAQARLSVEQVRRDVGIARDAYAKIHPGYMRYATAEEMDAAWSAIIETAERQGGMSEGALYLAISETLTRIRCDHTKAELPDRLAEARKGEPLYLPFLWEIIEGRGLITLPSDDETFAFGDEIVSIDGRPLSEVVATVSKYLPVDGYTEWSRNRAVTQISELMGGGVDHFGALLWAVPAEAVLEIRSADGTERTVTVPRMAYSDWMKLLAGNGRASNFKDALRFSRIGDDAALLSVDTFVNYRIPVDPQTLYQPIFAAMKEEGRDTLILDLRLNGGGSTDASMGLIANLVSEERAFMREFRVATLDHTLWEGMIGTWAPSALNPDPAGFIANADGSYTLRNGIMEDSANIIPTDTVFDGKLIVLTSANNSSGSTNILANLQSRPDTVTIGEPTGGSAEGPTAGVIFFLTLPESGMKLRIPMFRQWNNVESFDEGFGITPDIAAPTTVETMRAQRDPAMEKALELAAQS